MKRIVIIEKDWDNWKFSSNINEVTKAVLNLFLKFLSFKFFYEKILHAQKSTKKDKKHQKAQKRKPEKTQKCN